MEGSRQMLKIFKATITKTHTTDVLVMAEEQVKARYYITIALKNDRIDFDYSYDTDIDSIQRIEDLKDKNLLKEIRDYGIINEQAELIYDPQVLEDMDAFNTRKIKEKYLKENHLELNLGV